MGIEKSGSKKPPLVPPVGKDFIKHSPIFRNKPKDVDFIKIKK